MLTAFQDVEDQLVGRARAGASRPSCARQASDAADQAEQQMLNRYQAGQVSYTDVVTAQAVGAEARGARWCRSQVDRQTAAVALIQALGGGWDVAAPVEQELGAQDNAPDARRAAAGERIETP